MAIARMAKIVIVSHRSEVDVLLEALQQAGICQILNAEEAMVTKNFPELCCAGERPRDIEEKVSRVDKAITLLKNYAKNSKGLAGILAPRTVVEEQQYKKVVSDPRLWNIVEKALETQTTIEQLQTDCENLGGVLEMLVPWKGLSTPVEEIGQLDRTVCLAGLLPSQKFEQVTEEAGRLGAVVQRVGQTNNKYACLVLCFRESLSDVQKLLRSEDFEPVSFEGMNGTVAQLIEQYKEKLRETKQQLQAQHRQAEELAGSLGQLQILDDHYSNLLNREQTEAVAPGTDQTVILEGWVKEKDYSRLEQVVSQFGASSVSKIEPAEGEEPPVEIENKPVVKPFESITRLYGMPSPFDVDPTVFLAPFFAIFFGLCLTDAGYGLVMVAVFWFLLKKMQGDKKLIWMLLACSAVTVVAGAITGGWFGDAVQQFVPAMNSLRQKMLLFDPFEKPMVFFGLSLGLGYLQIIVGIVIAFVHNLLRRDYIAAVCDQLTWLVMLNSLVVFGFGKAGVVDPNIGGLFGYLAIVPAVAIVLFSQRQGGWGGRLGMGVYQLFSTVFYVGDVLSYVRLMALGMVTAGFGMAINVITKLVMDIPYVGVVLGAIVVVGGHLFNIAMSTLSSFVHSLRLQFVEFFPKFLVGGGKQFDPLVKRYRYVELKQS